MGVGAEFVCRRLRQIEGVEAVVPELAECQGGAFDDGPHVLSHHSVEPEDVGARIFFCEVPHENDNRVTHSRGVRRFVGGGLRVGVLVDAALFVGDACLRMDPRRLEKGAVVIGAQVD